MKNCYYEYSYSASNGSGVEYASLYSKPNYFYPINLDQLSLSLKYNRQRQAMITKELIEIISGAEAL